MHLRAINLTFFTLEAGQCEGPWIILQDWKQEHDSTCSFGNKCWYSRQLIPDRNWGSELGHCLAWHGGPRCRVAPRT